MHITGEKGIYNAQTREGYARNAAYNVMKHDKHVKESNIKNLDEIEFENIRYSKLKYANNDEYIKDAKIYAEETIKSVSNNGKASITQCIPKNTTESMRKMLEKFFSVLDLNNDGFVDLNENTAHVILMDSIKISDDLSKITKVAADGVIDSNNKKNIDRLILEKPEQAKQLLREQLTKIVFINFIK